MAGAALDSRPTVVLSILSSRLFAHPAFCPTTCACVYLGRYVSSTARDRTVEYSVQVHMLRWVPGALHQLATRGMFSFINLCCLIVYTLIE